MSQGARPSSCGTIHASLTANKSSLTGFVLTVPEFCTRSILRSTLNGISDPTSGNRSSRTPGTTPVISQVAMCRRKTVPRRFSSRNLTGRGEGGENECHPRNSSQAHRSPQGPDHQVQALWHQSGGSWRNCSAQPNINAGGRSLPLYLNCECTANGNGGGVGWEG